MAIWMVGNSLVPSMPVLTSGEDADVDVLRAG